MLRSLSPWALASLIVTLAIVAIVAVAVFDHELKIRRMNDASVTAWYCAHGGIRCEEDTPEAIEARWAERERAYKVAGGVLLFVGSVMVVANRRRSR